MTKRKKILSGFRPTGRLHLGHLVGALGNWLKLQNEADCFFMIADWHAITTDYADLKDLRVKSEILATEWLAAGLDPNKCTIFIQSDVPEHTELSLLFGMFTQIARLQRNPTYKEMINEIKEKDLLTFGFLGYPVLQAADILIYKATHVPVGVDQVPHIELTREIARRFNSLYKEIFPEPEPLLTEFPKLLGTDNRKMSKSYGNAILLTDTVEETSKKVMTMITDPARVRKNDPGHPDICTVFSYHKIWNKERIAQIETDCKAGVIGCTECKKELATILNQNLVDYRRRFDELYKDIDKVRDILEKGRESASEIASATMNDVKKAISMKR